MRLNGTYWDTVLQRNRTNTLESIVEDLLLILSLPSGSIVVEDVRVGSLIVEFSVYRNASYALPDDTINAIVLSAHFSRTEILYQKVLNITDGTEVLTTFTVKTSTNPANRWSCDTTCVTGILCGVFGFLALGGIALWTVVRLRRKTVKRNTALVAFEPTHVDDDGEYAQRWHDVARWRRRQRAASENSSNEPVGDMSPGAQERRHRIVLHRLRPGTGPPLSSSSSGPSVGDSSLEDTSSTAASSSDDSERARKKELRQLRRARRDHHQLLDKEDPLGSDYDAVGTSIAPVGDDEGAFEILFTDDNRQRAGGSSDEDDEELYALPPPRSEQHPAASVEFVDVAKDEPDGDESREHDVDEDAAEDEEEEERVTIGSAGGGFRDYAAFLSESGGSRRHQHGTPPVTSPIPMGAVSVAGRHRQQRGVRRGGRSTAAATGVTPPHRQPDYDDESMPLWSPATGHSVPRGQTSISRPIVFSPPEGTQRRSGTLILGSPQVIQPTNRLLFSSPRSPAPQQQQTAARKSKERAPDSLPSSWLHEAMGAIEASTTSLEYRHHQAPGLRRAGATSQASHGGSLTHGQAAGTPSDGVFSPPEEGGRRHELVSQTPAGSEGSSRPAGPSSVPILFFPPQGRTQQQQQQHAAVVLEDAFTDATPGARAGDTDDEPHVVHVVVSRPATPTAAVEDAFQRTPTAQRRDTFAIHIGPSPSPQRNAEWIGPGRAVSLEFVGGPTARAAVLDSDEGGEASTAHSYAEHYAGAGQLRLLPWMLRGQPGDPRRGSLSTGATSETVPWHQSAMESARAAGGDAEELFVGIVSSRASSADASGSVARGPPQQARSALDDFEPIGVDVGDENDTGGIFATLQRDALLPSSNDAGTRSQARAHEGNPEERSGSEAPPHPSGFVVDDAFGIFEVDSGSEGSLAQDDAAGTTRPLVFGVDDDDDEDRGALLPAADAQLYSSAAGLLDGGER